MLAEALSAVAVAADAKFELLAVRLDMLLDRVQELEKRPPAPDASRETLLALLDKLAETVKAASPPAAEPVSAPEPIQEVPPAMEPQPQPDPGPPPPEFPELYNKPDPDPQPYPEPARVPRPIAIVNGEIVIGPRGEAMMTKSAARMVSLLLTGSKTIRELSESESATGDRMALMKLTNMRTPLNDIGLDLRTRTGFWSLVEGGR